MSTRRSHNKTRLGCHQCKKRRIKCDGRHPICANCEKKSAECSFLLLAPSSRLSVASATSPAAESPSTHLISTPSPIGRVILGTELAIAPKIKRYAEECVEDISIQGVTDSCSLTPNYSSEYEIPATPIYPHLRLNDVWKDIRDLLPLPLQDVLYHYEYTTSLTLASDDPAKAAWQAAIPELAHSHNFLVNCVLSVASLHMARLHEGKAEKTNMNAIAASRMNKAITTYRSELETVTAENAAALFASATLTAVYLFRTSAMDIEILRQTISPNTIVPPADIIDKMMTYVLRPIWGLRGPLTVLMSGWDWVVGGKMHSVAARKWWPKKCIPATPRAQEEDDRLSSIEDLWLQSNRAYEPPCTHLSQALLILRETYSLISQLTLPNVYPPMTAVPYSVDDTTVGLLTDRGAIFVWATRISREFIALIEQKDRDALVILAHYAVLPGRVRNVWWLEGLGADFVTAIAMALGRENWGLIEWPARVVGLDLENAFGVRKDYLEGTPGEMHMEVI